VRAMSEFQSRKQKRMHRSLLRHVRLATAGQERLMMRETSQRLVNRLGLAAIHVPIGLDDLGSDNLAWLVEIASDDR